MKLSAKGKMLITSCIIPSPFTLLQAGRLRGARRKRQQESVALAVGQHGQKLTEQEHDRAQGDRVIGTLGRQKLNVLSVKTL